MKRHVAEQMLSYQNEMDSRYEALVAELNNARADIRELKEMRAVRNVAPSTAAAFWKQWATKEFTGTCEKVFRHHA